MSNINANFIEKYQLLYQRDPKSKVFAPLAEAYRKMGLIEEAYKICENGVKLHPHFPSGRVALAKVLLEKKMYHLAVEQLKVAVDLSPENILAHQLLAESHLHLKQMKEALKASKMVLFLNPNDEKAQKNVKKLESLTADEYDDDVFAMKRLTELSFIEEQKAATAASTTETRTKERWVERALSLTDAYIIRNDVDSALKTLDRTLEDLGPHPEITKRKKLITERMQMAVAQAPLINPTKVTAAPPEESKTDKRVEILKGLLEKVQSRRVQEP